jgi:ABC-type nitrate/sulfonate/bicarbonate transport system substrate-binding protein
MLLARRVGAMGTKRGRGRALLVTAVAVALAAGCSSGGVPPASQLEKPVLNVAVAPAVDSAGFFVALDQGLFKARGLTVNFIAATSSETAIAQQVAGAYTALKFSEFYPISGDSTL